MSVVPPSELDFPTKDVDEAIARVRALIDRSHAERPDKTV